jgi:hypothetical protein
MKVGIQRNEYPERRNITFIKRSSVEFRMVESDFCSSPSFVSDNLSKSKFFREYSFHFRQVTQSIASIFLIRLL